MILVNARNQVLLQRRVDNGLWGYHGGATELYERVEDAARRELKEETGLTARELTLLGVFSGPEMKNTYPNGDVCSIVDVVYLCREYTGELHAQAEEVSELKWFDAGCLPPLTPACRPAMLAWQQAVNCVTNAH